MSGCEYCGGYFRTETAAEVGVCDDCAELMVARAHKRRDWQEWHGPDEPCPEIELPPMPKRIAPELKPKTEGGGDGAAT
jgi:hypothetical protein